MMSEASSPPRAARRRATSGLMCVAASSRELGDGCALGPCWSVQDHDFLEGFESRHVGKQLHEVGTEQVGHGEEQTSSRGSQDVPGLLSAVAGIQRHQHRTDGIDGEAGDHPVGAVGGPQGHAISGLDPTAHERPRHLVHSFGQLAKRKSTRSRRQRFVVPVVLRCLVQAPRGSSEAADRPTRCLRLCRSTRMYIL